MKCKPQYHRQDKCNQSTGQAPDPACPIVCSKTFFFSLYTIFVLFIELECNGLSFGGGKSYNWWIHKLANIDANNYALLVWLVNLYLFHFCIHKKLLHNFSIFLLLVIFQNKGKQIFSTLFCSLRAFFFWTPTAGGSGQCLNAYDTWLAV